MARRQPEVIYQADGTAIIPLTKGLVTVIDQQDTDLGAVLWVAQSSSGHIYAARGVRNGGRWTLEYLHRVVLARALGRPLRPGEEVDHIDGNPLNNRRSNLRLANRAQNKQNSRARSSSGYKGVTWDKQRRKWRARIRHNGHLRYLGLFDSRIEAARAYDDAARQLFGPYAALNFPRDGEQPARPNHKGNSLHESCTEV